MPFTVNVGPYQGGTYLSQGLSNLGSGIAEGIYKNIQQQDMQNKEMFMLDNVVNQGAAMAKAGLVTLPEGVDLAKYPTLSLAQKRVVGSKIAAQIATSDILRKQKDEEEAARKGATMDWYRQQAIWSDIQAKSGKDIYGNPLPTQPGAHIPIIGPDGRTYYVTPDKALDYTQRQAGMPMTPEQQTLDLERRQKIVQGFGVTSEQLFDPYSQHAATYDSNTGKYVNTKPGLATHIYYGPYQEDLSKLKQTPLPVDIHSYLRSVLTGRPSPTGQPTTAREAASSAQAINWASQHQDDPRARAIFQAHGIIKPTAAAAPAGVVQPAGAPSAATAAPFGPSTVGPTPTPAAVTTPAPSLLPTAAPPGMSPQDQVLLQWAQQNPDDPRAQQILAQYSGGGGGSSY